MKKSILILGLVAAAPLAGCGLQGELERPEPLRGAAAERDYGARRPVTPQENYDPTSTTRSPRAAPIPGTSDPFGPPPSLNP